MAQVGNSAYPHIWNINLAKFKSHCPEKFRVLLGNWEINFALMLSTFLLRYSCPSPNRSKAFFHFEKLQKETWINNNILPPLNYNYTKTIQNVFSF